MTQYNIKVGDSFVYHWNGHEYAIYVLWSVFDEFIVLHKDIDDFEKDIIKSAQHTLFTSLDKRVNSDSELPYGTLVLLDDKELIFYGYTKITILKKIITKPLFFDVNKAQRIITKYIKNLNSINDFLLEDIKTKLLECFYPVYADLDNLNYTILSKPSIPQPVINIDDVKKWVNIKQMYKGITDGDLGAVSIVFDTKTLQKIENRKVKSKLNTLMLKIIEAGITNKVFSPDASLPNLKKQSQKSTDNTDYLSLMEEAAKEIEYFADLDLDSELDI